MKYQYSQNKYGGRIEPYYCDNYWCEGGSACECGMSFEEVKDMVIRYYEGRLEWAKGLQENG